MFQEHERTLYVTLAKYLGPKKVAQVYFCRDLWWLYGWYGIKSARFRDRHHVCAGSKEG